MGGSGGRSGGTRRGRLGPLAALYAAVAVAAIVIVRAAVGAGAAPERTLPWAVAVALVGFVIACAVAWRGPRRVEGANPDAPVQPAWGATAALVALAAGGLVASSWWALRPAPDHAVRSLAVLPLANLTGESEQQYLVDGVHEALIAELGRVEELTVISRTSVLPYRSTKLGARAIAAALGVDALVEGSVFREGDSLRITVQLVRGSPEARLWGSSFDGSLGRTLELQRRVARGITDAVRIRVGEEGPDSPVGQPANGLAQDEYLRGRAQWRSRSGPDLARAVEHLEHAVELEPTFALAHAALADAYVVARGYGAIDVPWDEAYARAERSARRALELDPSLGEAHASLGFLRFQADWDVESAEQGLRTGLELNPSYAQGHAWLSSVLRARGRPAEAVAEARRARQLDPFSAVMNRYLGFTLAKTGNCVEAERHAATAVELDPQHPDAYWILWTCDVLERRRDEAVEHAATAYRGWGVSSDAVEGYERAYHRGGWNAALEAELALLVDPAIPVRTEYARAQRLAMLGRTDEAFAMLDAALQARDPLLLFELRTDPLIASLRDDPRYADLAARVGVAD